MNAGRPFEMENAMKTQQTSLKSFEQIARSRGVGTLVAGAVLIAVWLGGHGALYSAYRITSAHSPSLVAELQ